MISKFVHLHLHTKYSLLDGMCKIEDIIEFVKKYEMSSVAITDHGNMYGVIEFYTSLVKEGIKPIIGMETYIVDNIKNNTREKYHLLLLVKNITGYKNLIRISSFGFTEGFYYKPTIDKNFLKEHSEGLIGLTSCMQGEVPSKVISGDLESATEIAKEYLSIFGEGNFYLELQNHNLEDEKIMNNGLKEISKKLSIPLVATNDVHYLKKEDAKAQEILLCIQTGKTLKNIDRLHFKTNEFYFKNYEEMKELFPDDEETLERTLEISKKCNFELPMPENKKSYYMPTYEIKDGSSYEEYFEKIVREEFNKKYPQSEKSLIDRLNHEIDVIKKLGYAGYFLIVRDIVNFAKENNIPVGPGRGSAAGSLVSFVLGITNIDPIKYGLLFERFLNPNRISPPDIDIDFADEERDKVIEFIIEKFGKDKVAQIITFQQLKARQAIRDVGRVLDIPLKEVDELAKHVPEGINIKFDDILKNQEFLDFINQDKTGTREKIVSYAIKIEGMLRQDSTHAAGVVIAPDTLLNFVPIAVPKDNTKSKLNYMTQYPMESLEKIGLLKFDILGLRNLTIIKKTLDIIKEIRGIEVKLDTDDFSDAEVYDLLQRGNTIGVFQLESEGMRDILKKLKPSSFEEIIAIISLFRPGPMKMIDSYIRRKKGLEEVSYDFPELEEVLKETYGIPIYQEQVMQIAVKIAGFSMADADSLRRAMAKKKGKEFSELRKKFIKGAIDKGISKEKIEELASKLEQFSQYGFNKSHAAAYAVLAYQTAYLKAHFTVEYMTALLTSVMDKVDKIAFYIEDCRKNGIHILPPDVNNSGIEFKVEKNMIRYGLAAIKNVGVSAAEEIVKKRLEGGEYKDLFDFCRRVDMRIVNSKTIESLIKAGAFDFMLMPRHNIFSLIDKAMKEGEVYQKDMEIGQASLFEIEKNNNIKINNTEIVEWNDRELLNYEKEVLGFYLSYNPLARYEKLLKNVSTPIKDINKGLFSENKTVIIGGVAHEVTKKLSPSGKERYNILLEDLTDKIKIIINEEISEKKKNILEENVLFMVRGRISYYDEKPYIFVDGIITLDEAYLKLGKYIHIKLREVGLDDILMQQILNILRKHTGDSEVILHLITKDNKEILLFLKEKIKPSEEILSELEEIIGEDNLWLTWKL